MIIKHFEAIKAEPVTTAGATKTKIRWLITKADGATGYAMRVFEMEPGAVIPSHTHDFEQHEIFVLEGSAKVTSGGKEFRAKKGDAIFVPVGEAHSYINDGKKPFKFICVIPVK
ncbi:MAG: cupin domain-containing protein [candidate division WOR-3 bacterium]|nr:cupin domain-containing protein [candidate division WOR-3 bacterium]MDH5684775.1 cupin domain-containing protein [candidate division WOR-3 bacterium]